MYLLSFLFTGEAFCKTQWLIVNNTTAADRIKEVISVNRSVFNENDHLIFPQVKIKNTICITQLVDTNKDGLWDEILIEITLAAHSKDTLQINWVRKAQLPAWKKYTHVRLSLRSDHQVPAPAINTAIRLRGFVQDIAKPFYQMEGPGIENDKVAFRAFFDSRNGKDIFGKLVDTMVLDKVGVGTTWHQLQPWGMDILKVGNSLGAGALAVQDNKKIYRLADADTSTFESEYEGPLQAAFRLSFTNWDVGTGKEKGNETVSISKGTFFYKNDIVVPLHQLQKLIVGFANFGINNIVYKKHNSLFSSISTYGKQAEGTETNLGLAILFSAGDYVESRTADTTSSIPNTSYVVLKPSGNNRKTIYFFACWEKTDRRFQTQQGFQHYLQTTAALLANPIQIKIITKKQ